MAKEAGPGLGDSGPLWNHFWNATLPAGADTESESCQTIESTEYNSVQPIRSSSQISNPQAEHLVSSSDSTLLPRVEAVVTPSKKTPISFKLRNSVTGRVYRFSMPHSNFADLLTTISEKTGLAMSSTTLPSKDARPPRPLLSLRDSTGKDMKLSYFDDDGDAVLLNCDKDMTEALLMSHQLGWTRLELFLGYDVPQPCDRPNPQGRPRGWTASPSFIVGVSAFSVAVASALFLVAKQK